MFERLVNVGEAIVGELAVILFAATNAVVAICVELLPKVAVGAVGEPVSAGEANGAYVDNAVGLTGVNPSAVVTSVDCKVMAPVLVLNDATLAEVTVEIALVTNAVVAN